MLGRAAATGLVRSVPSIRSTPTTWASFRVSWAGSAVIATTDFLSALSASRIYHLLQERQKLVVKIGKAFVGLADFFVFQLCG